MRRTATLIALFLMLLSGAIAPRPAHAAPGVATLSCTPPATDPEIASLARALNYDLSQIYEYVYYNVDFSPTFGSKKGALGTLLDRVGTNVDQNVLFVALLKQSCISASYRSGVIGVPAASAANLFGVANDAALLRNVLGNGGIPACVMITSGTCTTTETGPATTVNIQLVWTEATVGSTVYGLDPSLKSYASYAPINVGAAAGYDRGSFLNGVTSGSSAVSDLPSGVTSIKSLNRTNLTSSLGTYSGTLANYIQTNFPSRSAKQLFGGRDITNANYGSTLSGGTLSSTVPSSYETVYTVTVSDNADGSNPSLTATLYGSQIGSRRLTLTYASNAPTLKLEGTTVAAGSATSATVQVVSLTVANPYAAGAAYNTYTVRPVVQTGGTYAVMLAAGESGRDTLTRHQTALAALKQAGAAQDSEAVLGEALAAVGSTYLSQSARAAQLISGIGATVLVRHEAMGIAGYKTAPYVDFPAQLDSVSPANTNVTNAAMIGQGIAFNIYNSTLESTSVTQMQQNPALSTVRAFDIANTNSVGFIQVSSSNWPSVRSKLTSWSSSDLTNMGNYLATDPSNFVILPQNGSQTTGAWTGSGYYQIGQSSSILNISYLISGGYKGAFGTVAGFDSTLPAIVSVQASGQYAYTPVYSLEPINMLSGSYTYDHDDISVGGQFPFGLTLKRSYDSGNRTTRGPLGYGWRHNFGMTALVDSDSYECFGDHNPVAAVATVVAAYVMTDLESQPSLPVANTVTSSLTASWLMDQLVNNAVTLSLSDVTKRFAVIPTGSGSKLYVPPPGDASTLVVATDKSMTLTDTNKVVISFNTNGAIASWADPNGNSVSFTYTGSGAAALLQSVSNGMGRTLTFSYSGTQLTSVTDGNRTVSYAYDGSSNLTSYKDTTQAQTTFGYGGTGQLKQIFYPTFPNTPFVTNVYDQTGRMATQTDALGNVWYYLFANGLRSQEVDPAGGTHVLYYDRIGNQTLDINQVGDTTSMSYDGVGRLVTTTYPLGDSVVLAYDARNNILKKTTNPIPGSVDTLTGQAAAATVQNFTYDPTFGKVLTATDPLGNVTTNAYDANGNLTKITQPAVKRSGASAASAPVTSYTYGSRGRVATQTDPEGRVTSFGYAATTFDLTSTVVDAGSGRLNLTTSMTYDGAGNVATSRDANGNTTSMAYDAMRRLTSRTAPAPFGATQTQVTYDADGRQKTSSQATGGSPAQLTTTTAYNAAGKPTVVTASDGTTQTTAYDTVGRAATVTSSSGRQVITSYDLASRITTITDAVSGQLDPSIIRNQGSTLRERRSYYPSGLLATLTDGNNNTLTYYYDAFKRQKQIVYPSSTSASPDYDLHAFDANGNDRVFQRRDGSQIATSFDALNRRVSKAATNQATISYGYDNAGRLLSALASNDNAAHQIQYDTAGRKIGEYSPLFGWTTATLDANGNTVSLVYPPSVGATTAFSYDALNRLSGVYDGSVASGVRIGGYAYDTAGRRSGVTYGPASAAVATTSLSYTAASQLASLSHTWSGAMLGLSYSYNADHQRTQVSATDASFLPSGLPAGSTSYARNALNQYSSVGAAAYVYDKRGNLTSDGVWSYGYDTENRLISASKSASPSVTASYGYDALGRRLLKTINGVSTAWSSWGNQELAEYQGTGTIYLQRRFVYGPGLDEPLASLDASNARSYQFADAQGSVIGQANASGQLTEKYAYTAFGVGVVSGPGTAAYRYAGRRWDAETGLYHNRARAYSPALGRFLQVDPIGTQGGINLYAYVGNDPLNATDPMGTDALVIRGEYNQVNGGYNYFGHIAIAVSGAGVYSYGTGTAFGSSVSEYVNSQSSLRNQTIYLIKTTPEEDSKMLNYLRGETSTSGIYDNCAARTCNALNAGGVLNSYITARTPSAVEYQIQSSGRDITTYSLSRNSSVSSSITSQFEQSKSNAK